MNCYLLATISSCSKLSCFFHWYSKWRSSLRFLARFETPEESRSCFASVISASVSRISRRKPASFAFASEIWLAVRIGRSTCRAGFAHLALDAFLTCLLGRLSRLPLGVGAAPPRNSKLTPPVITARKACPQEMPPGCPECVPLRRLL